MRAGLRQGIGPGFAVGAVVLAGFAAAGPSARAAGPGPARTVPVSRAVSSGARTLTVVEPGVPDTLNPLLTRTAAGADAVAPVFDSLVRIDGNGTVRPDLAVRWSRSVDARTWQFTLNPRARWHDGEPVTAGDVAFTIRLVRNAGFGAASTVGFDRVVTITVVDPHTLVLHLRASYAPFLATVGAAPILPAHVLAGISAGAIRDETSFNRHPIGSGPFVVAQFTADGHVVEDANPDYFGGPPHLDRLAFAPAASRRTALALVAHGDTSLLAPSFGLGPADVLSLPAFAQRRVLYTPSFAWTHLDLIEHGLFKSPLVRRALALATPREQIVATVLHGHGQICDGDQAPGTPAYEPALYGSYHFDLSAARQRLLRAGFVPAPGGRLLYGGQPLTVNLWGDAGCKTCVTALGLVAGGWRGLGVVVMVHLVPTEVLFGPRGPLYDPDRFTASAYNAVFYTWVNGPDPDDSAYWTHNAIVTSDQPFGGNFDGYSNRALDRLITDALVTPTGPVRYALYHQIQHVVTTDQPDVFLYWADMVSVVPPRLTGYRPTPYDGAATWNARDWRLTP